MSAQASQLEQKVDLARRALEYAKGVAQDLEELLPTTLGRVGEQSARLAKDQAQHDEREKAFRVRIAPLGELSEASAALTDFVMSENPNEPWAVSLAYLVSLSVSGLTVARVQANAPAEAAMLTNLYGILDALRDRFAAPPGPVARWSYAIEAMGPRPAPPAHPGEDHPHRSNLQRHVRAVRDVALRSFGQYFALDRSQVYVIRPA